LPVCLSIWVTSTHPLSGSLLAFLVSIPDFPKLPLVPLQCSSMISYLPLIMAPIILDSNDLLVIFLLICFIFFQNKHYSLLSIHFHH
jgi:hypothetical protein